MPSILYITPIDNYNTTLHNITKFIDINNTMYSEIIKENKEDGKNIGALLFIIFIGVVVIVAIIIGIIVWVKESNHTKNWVNWVKQKNKDFRFQKS